MNEIRRKKLAVLIKERFEGNQSAFGIAIGKTASQVNMWLSGARNMTRDSCENIEVKLRLPRGWMDDDVDSPPSTASNRLKIQIEDKTNALTPEAAQTADTNTAGLSPAAIKMAKMFDLIVDGSTDQRLIRLAHSAASTAINAVFIEPQALPTDTNESKAL